MHFVAFLMFLVFLGPGDDGFFFRIDYCFVSSWLPWTHLFCLMWQSAWTSWQIFLRFLGVMLVHGHLDLSQSSKWHPAIFNMRVSFKTKSLAHVIIAITYRSIPNVSTTDFKFTKSSIYVLSSKFKSILKLYKKTNTMYQIAYS